MLTRRSPWHELVSPPLAYKVGVYEQARIVAHNVLRSGDANDSHKKNQFRSRGNKKMSSVTDERRALRQRNRRVGFSPSLTGLDPTTGFVQTLNRMTKRSPSSPFLMTAWRDNPTCVRGPVMAPLRALDWSGVIEHTRVVALIVRQVTETRVARTWRRGMDALDVQYSNNRASERSLPFFFCI